jgi:hypothetical protein
VAVPSIQIGHWPDRFNHTSADTLDKVDPQEIRRAGLIAGSCALSMAMGSPRLHADVARITVQHALRRLFETSALPVCQADESRIFSPRAERRRGELLDFVADCGKRQIAALETMTGQTLSHGRAAIDQQKGLLCALHGFELLPHRCAEQEAIIHRLWPGPFNVRGLLARCDGEPADRLRRFVSTNRRGYATVLALALAIDGQSSRASVVRRAAYASMLDIEHPLAEDLFDAMHQAKWVRETSA